VFLNTDSLWTDQDCMALSLLLDDQETTWPPLLFIYLLCVLADVTLPAEWTLREQYAFKSSQFCLVGIDHSLWFVACEHAFVQDFDLVSNSRLFQWWHLSGMLLFRWKGKTVSSKWSSLARLLSATLNISFLFLMFLHN